MKTSAARLAIGTLSKHTGTNVETIRYYERVRLLPAPARTPGGYRLYETEHLKRLSFIRRARALGFSLRSWARTACQSVRSRSAADRAAMRFGYTRHAVSFRRPSARRPATVATQAMCWHC